MKKEKSSVSIKKNKNSKIYKYGKKQVDKAFFGTTDPNIGYYEFVNLYPRRNRLLRLVVNGKTKLYERTVKRSELDGGGGVINSKGEFFKFNKSSEAIKVKEFYAIRSREKFATRLVGHVEMIPFKNRVKKYFYDCKDIVEYIENDLYDKRSLKRLVKDYNLLCF